MLGIKSLSLYKEREPGIAFQPLVIHPFMNKEALELSLRDSCKPPRELTITRSSRPFDYGLLCTLSENHFHLNKSQRLPVKHPEDVKELVCSWCVQVLMSAPQEKLKRAYVL